MKRREKQIVENIQILDDAIQKMQIKLAHIDWLTEHFNASFITFGDREN